MDETALARELENTPVREFRYFNSIGSTNDEALQWADAGAPDFALVIAEEQSKGRGRFTRRWVTKPGSALAFSLILQPTPAELANVALFAPLCGLALRDTLESAFGLDAEIKWPNDVLLAGKKTAGILVEAAWSGNNVAGIILGIGINVSSSALPPNDSQLFAATCIEDHVNHTVDRIALLQQLLNSLAEWRGKLGTPNFIEEWQQHLGFKGQMVLIEDSQKTSIIGVVKGINTAGNLVLTLEDGQEKDFAVGDVHLRLMEQNNTGGT